MLFSNESIAEFINSSFESAWESVRPVPIVRIDFGDGNVITRTLHGNIATYVCSSDGMVLDVLPGIYTPAAYRNALNQLRILARNVRQKPDDARLAYLRGYHQRQAEALRTGRDAQTLATEAAAVPVGKRVIERPVETLLKTKGVADSVVLHAPEDLAQWQALVEDTRLNEKTRRQLIHERLQSTGLVRPDAISRWLYKEVLHADLDDPYLGLGQSLFASYPFRREEAPR